MAMTKAEMKKLIDVQNELVKRQREVIEAQHKIIALQQRVEDMTPKNMPDESIFWHKHSGMMSTDAANSNDVKVVREYQAWLTEFAKKCVKPYVNPKVFGEVLNQMTRGLTSRIVELEMKQDARISKFKPANKSANIIQFALFDHEARNNYLAQPETAVIHDTSQKAPAR